MIIKMIFMNICHIKEVKLSTKTSWFYKIKLTNYNQIKK